MAARVTAFFLSFFLKPVNHMDRLGVVAQDGEEKPKIRYPCRDMRGRVHDADVLRKRRIKVMILPFSCEPALDR